MAFVFLYKSVFLSTCVHFRIKILHYSSCYFSLIQNIRKIIFFVENTIIAIISDFMSSKNKNDNYSLKCNKLFDAHTVYRINIKK